MITLHTVELAISVITFFVAYLVVITCSNVFRAWVAHKMGDDTGILLGYATWNPFFHIDPIGVVCLFIFYFGWGRIAPINPLNIWPPYRDVKLAIVYLSDTAIRFVMSIIGIIALLAIFDINILTVMRYMVLTYHVSHLPIANMYPDVSNFAVSVGFIIFSFVYLNVVLGVLNFIMNFSNYMLFVCSDRYDRIARYADALSFGIPIFLILFFSPLLRLIAVNVIGYIGFSIAYMCGIAQ
jgi:hypothetical protein